MEQYIIVYSRYVIAVLMAVYTVLALVRAFRKGLDERRLDNGASALIFLIQFVAFLTICVETGDVDYLFFYAFSQLVLFAFMMLFLMIYPKMYRPLVNHMCILLGTGFFVLARLDFEKAAKQLVIAAISIGLSMLIPYVITRMGGLLKRLTFLYAAIGLAALLIVLILGQITHGSRLSFSIAGLSFQPSEFVKLLFVFFLAALLGKEASFKRVAISAAVAGAHVLILVFSRDLGSALIFYVAYVFLVFYATGQFRYLLFGGAGGVAAAMVAYRLFSHVQVRVQAWRDPWSVIDSQGYQITQSLFALSRGGWFGLGLGQGTPKDIPYVDTDFIFAAVTEEMGLLFAVCLILICVATYLSFVKIASIQEEPFYKLLSSGLGVMYIFQIFLTIGGGIKFIPLTGVTLPLVSYGGSSVMATLFLFGIQQGICIRSRRRRNAVYSGYEDEGWDDWDEEERDDEAWEEGDWDDGAWEETGWEDGREDWIESEGEDEEEYRRYEDEEDEDAFTRGYENSPDKEILWEEEDDRWAGT